jgi:hypothetical protein
MTAVTLTPAEVKILQEERDNRKRELAELKQKIDAYENVSPLKLQAVVEENVSKAMAALSRVSSEALRWQQELQRIQLEIARTQQDPPSGP